MVNSSDSWIRVSHASPCPVCEKPDNCTVSSDGKMVWCGRISNGSIRENQGGQFLHRLREDDRYVERVQIPIPQPKQKAPRTDLPAIASAWSRNATEPRNRLAKHLGISLAGLTALDVGWNESSRCWSFPEKDASGNIIGVNTRMENGSKMRLAGGKAGLTYSCQWNKGSGPVLLVEGGSDTAALTGIGLNAVGRPSNLGGVALLTELLADVSIQQDIVVIGERDLKPNGHWPGKEGAIKTARKLADALNRTVFWSLPPDNAKDSRAWLQQFPELPPDSAAALYISGLNPIAVNPPPFFVAPIDTAPEMTITEWRQQMLHARLNSLGTPGFYLDSSVTGSGKSSIDFEVILNMSRIDP
jgi:hypothetical protein